MLTCIAMLNNRPNALYIFKQDSLRGTKNWQLGIIISIVKYKHSCTSLGNKRKLSYGQWRARRTIAISLAQQRSFKQNKLNSLCWCQNKLGGDLVYEIIRSGVESESADLICKLQPLLKSQGKNYGLGIIKLLEHNTIIISLRNKRIQEECIGVKSAPSDRSVERELFVAAKNSFRRGYCLFTTG